MYLSITFLASSACRFANGKSSEEVLTAWSINDLAVSAASAFALALVFTLGASETKELMMTVR